MLDDRSDQELADKVKISIISEMKKTRYQVYNIVHASLENLPEE